MSSAPAVTRRPLVAVAVALLSVTGSACTYDTRSAWTPNNASAAAAARDISIQGGASEPAKAPWVAAVTPAIDRVHAVWRRSPGRVHLVVPRESAERLRALAAPQGTADDGEIAVTVFRADGAQIVVRPGIELTPQGYEAVLAHELAHVAQRQVGTYGTGTWPLEGSAMYTQYRGEPMRGHPDTALVASRARAGTLPQAPPPTGVFTGAESSRLAYQEAWTMCAYLVSLRDEQALVAWIDDIARGDNANTALRHRFGISEEELVKQWAAWVQRWA